MDDSSQGIVTEPGWFSPLKAGMNYRLFLCRSKAMAVARIEACNYFRGKFAETIYSYTCIGFALQRVGRGARNITYKL